MRYVRPVALFVILVMVSINCTLTSVIPQGRGAALPTLTGMSIAATATVTPLPDPVITNEAVSTDPQEAEPSQRAMPVVATNQEWTPHVQEFSGVNMVLVPPGCFIMGDPNGSETERLVSQQCFEQPFWIDRYEVSNIQFGSAGMFTGDLMPRDSVRYARAEEHCVRRGARLPTEAEWEYAARGPDSLMYPWGNEMQPQAVTYVGNANNRTSSVGAYPQGQSWVGAFDMAGNLWEWTSTIYDENRFPYPYQRDDGREAQQDTQSYRVIRGGAYSTDAFFLRGASRKGKHPSQEWYGYVGFRCARDFEPADLPD